jgi:hypothetical protein
MAVGQTPHNPSSPDEKDQIAGNIDQSNIQ